MMIRVLSGLVLACGWFASGLVAQDQLEGVKCPVMEQAAAKAGKVVEYQGGKVFFCCDRCVAKFQAEPDKFAARANHQLVRTGQFNQVACPLSGNPANELQTTDVGGVSVAFCCGGCKGNVANAESDAAKMEMVFASTAFSKGFAAAADDIDLKDVKCMFMVRKDVNPEKFAEFEGSKVFFCCDNCLKRFNSKPEDHATKAHHQMVRTGQVKQTACPISGHDMDDEVVTEVAGVKVRFCCAHCQAKVTDAETDEQRVELIFGAEGYKNGFSKKD
ncbi:MAG TPA: hypothetical protein PKD54_15915 [Pirellulaceae bacterium]|nr:hypothetical protein [Pirellulaceae bacterium]